MDEVPPLPVEVAPQILPHPLPLPLGVDRLEGGAVERPDKEDVAVDAGEDLEMTADPVPDGTPLDPHLRRPQDTPGPINAAEGPGFPLSVRLQPGPQAVEVGGGGRLEAEAVRLPLRAGLHPRLPGRPGPQPPGEAIADQWRRLLRPGVVGDHDLAAGPLSLVLQA